LRHCARVVAQDHQVSAHGHGVAQRLARALPHPAASVLAACFRRPISGAAYRLFPPRPGVCFTAVCGLARLRSCAARRSRSNGPGYIGSLLWLVGSSALLAFAVYLTLVGHIGAARAGYATVLFPIFPLMISTLIEEYQWSLFSLAGLVLAIGGNYFVLSRKRGPSNNPLCR